LRFKENEQGMEENILIAAIFIGVIEDADWNTLGYIGLQEVGNAYNVETAYSQKVN